MDETEVWLGLPEYQITKVERKNGKVCLSVRYTGAVQCPHCGCSRLRNRERYVRRVRHENLGMRPCVLEIEAHKWQCRECRRYFRQRFPGNHGKVRVVIALAYGRSQDSQSTAG